MLDTIAIATSNIFSYFKLEHQVNLESKLHLEITLKID